MSGFRWSPEPEPPRVVRLGGAAAPAEPAAEDTKHEEPAE